MPGKDEELLEELLDVSILISEAPDIVSEAKAEVGSEEKELLKELLEELLVCEEPEKGQLPLRETEPVDTQELRLGEDRVLLEVLLYALILTSEAPEIVSEVKAALGREAKVGVELLHSDIVVVISDAIDAVSAISISEVIVGSEFIVGLSIRVGSVWCLNVGLDVDSVVGCSDDVMPGTKI